MNLMLVQKLLADAGKRWPYAWKLADQIRAMMKAAWDGRIFIPYNVWEYLFHLLSQMVPPGIDEREDSKILQVLAAWRPGQDVVKFDPDLYASIAATPLTGTLPSDILLRLPAWAVYVEAPGIHIEEGTYDGFLVFLDHDTGEWFLRFMFIAPDVIAHYAVPLGEMTLEEALERLRTMVRKVGNVEIRSNYADGIETAINLTLYLCAYGFSDGVRRDSTPVYPAAKKTKKGWRLFPPEKPKIHVLGEEIGRQIKEARVASHSVGNRGEIRPHIRRAHWHGFWSGSKKDVEKRKFDLKWLPPIPVAMKDDEE